jgi:hypothetical protein
VVTAIVPVGPALVYTVIARQLPRDEGRWSDRSSAGVKAWSDPIAALAADALVEARLVSRDDFDKVAAVIAEEVFVRLCLRDFPPGGESELPPSDA